MKAIIDCPLSNQPRDPMMIGEEIAQYEPIFQSELCQLEFQLQPKDRVRFRTSSIEPPLTASYAKLDDMTREVMGRNIAVAGIESCIASAGDGDVSG